MSTHSGDMLASCSGVSLWIQARRHLNFHTLCGCAHHTHTQMHVQTQKRCNPSPTHIHTPTAAYAPPACCMEDALIAYAAMACPASAGRPAGACLGKGKAGAAAPARPPSSGLQDAACAQAEVLAAAEIMEAVAAAPLLPLSLGEDPGRTPALALPIRISGGSSDRPLSGLRLGVYQEVRNCACAAAVVAHVLLFLR